jgi:hypothetical protein
MLLRNVVPGYLVELDLPRVVVLFVALRQGVGHDVVLPNADADEVGAEVVAGQVRQALLGDDPR